MDPAGITHPVRDLIHRTQCQVVAARGHSEPCALHFDEQAGRFGQAAQGRVGGGRAQTSGERGSPSPQMIPKKLPLCLPAQVGAFGAPILAQRVGFLRRLHAHELEFQTQMILSFTGVFGHFQSERAIERRQIREPMRLKERVGLEIAILDLV